jgi:hypothetical protein
MNQPAPPGLGPRAIKLWEGVSGKKSGPRARLTEARWTRYCDNSTPVEAGYGTTRSSATWSSVRRGRV